MSVKNRIDRQIKRLRRDEANVDFDNEQEVQAFAAKHGLGHEADAQIFAHLEGLIADWEHGIRPSDDDIDFIMEVLPYAVLPRSGGRLRKSEQANDHVARIKAEARDLQRQNRNTCLNAAAAWTATVIEMKRRHPEELANKSEKTLIDMWSRR